MSKVTRASPTTSPSSQGSSPTTSPPEPAHDNDLAKSQVPRGSGGSGAVAGVGYPESNILSGLLADAEAEEGDTILSGLLAEDEEVQPTSSPRGSGGRIIANPGPSRRSFMSGLLAEDEGGSTAQEGEQGESAGSEEGLDWTGVEGPDFDFW